MLAITEMFLPLLKGRRMQADALWTLCLNQYHMSGDWWSPSAGHSDRI